MLDVCVSVSHSDTPRRCLDLSNISNGSLDEAAAQTSPQGGFHLGGQTSFTTYTRLGSVSFGLNPYLLDVIVCFGIFVLVLFCFVLFWIIKCV